MYQPCYWFVACSLEMVCWMHVGPHVSPAHLHDPASLQGSSSMPGTQEGTDCEAICLCMLRGLMAVCMLCRART